MKKPIAYHGVITPRCLPIRAWTDVRDNIQFWVMKLNGILLTEEQENRILREAAEAIEAGLTEECIGYLHGMIIRQLVDNQYMERQRKYGV